MSANIRKIAVTGGLAAGKSTFSDLLGEVGAFVIKTDEIVHHLLSSDSNTIREVTAAFGDDIRLFDKVDRKKLAYIVFDNQKNLKLLEEILHPRVKKELEKAYENRKKEGKTNPFVVEVPLLFESHLDSWFDLIIYIKTPIELAKKRFIEKGFSETDFSNRNRRFLKEEEKMQRSHIVIDGSLPISTLKEKAEQLV